MRSLPSYVTVPLFPLLFVGFLMLFMVLFGFIHMIPWLGDFWSGLLWWLMMIFGLLIQRYLVRGLTFGAIKR